MGSEVGKTSLGTTMAETEDKDRFNVSRTVSTSKLKPPVTVIVPFHGYYAGVVNIVDQIFNKNSYQNFQLILGDDGSPNKSFTTRFEKFPNTLVIKQEKHKGFGGIINSCLKNCKTELFVILHSDVEIIEYSWLKQLVDSYYKIEDRSKLGFILLPSDNTTVKNKCLDYNCSDIHDKFMKIEGSHIPLYCAMGNLSMVRKIGLFREYPYGYFEDQEYYNRMNKNGYISYVNRATWVRHQGMKTFEEIFAQDPSAIQKVKDNYNLLQKDLGKKLATSS